MQLEGFSQDLRIKSVSQNRSQSLTLRDTIQFKRALWLHVRLQRSLRRSEGESAVIFARDDENNLTSVDSKIRQVLLQSKRNSETVL